MVKGKSTTAATSAAGVGNGGNTGQIARTSATEASFDLNSLGQKQTNGTIKNGKNGEDEMKPPSSSEFSTNTATLPSDPSSRALSALLIRALNSAATASPPRRDSTGDVDMDACAHSACAQNAKRIWPLCPGLSYGGTGDLPVSAATNADTPSSMNTLPARAAAVINTQSKSDADAGNAPHPATQGRRGRLTLVSYPMSVFKGNAERYIDAEPFLTPSGKLNLCTLLTDAEQNYESRADRWLRFYVRMVESGVAAREREKWVQGVLERRHSMMMEMGENMFLGEVKDSFRR